MGAGIVPLPADGDPGIWFEFHAAHPRRHGDMH